MDVETTIVGAGPYGLSLAAHLRAARRPFVQLGTPMESWHRYMPEGMLLKSERFASNLWDPERRYTLERFSRERSLPYQPVGDPLSLGLFQQYAAWFRERAVGEIRDVRVIALRHTPSGFGVRLSDGTEYSSRRVVLATGHIAFRFVPSELADLPEPLVMHSARIGDVKAYVGRKVCVIGAGQSALETAALLHENGARVHLLVRRERLEWNAPSRARPLPARILEPDAGVATGWKSIAVSELPRTFRFMFAPDRRHRFVAGSYGPSGSWWLRERVMDRVEISLSTRVTSAAIAAGAVRLTVETSGRAAELQADHVVAATGYRIDMDRLEYLDPGLAQSIARENAGIPALDSRYGTSVSGLFIIGLGSAPVFGPIMRFMYGAKHAAPVLARRLRA